MTVHSDLVEAIAARDRAGVADALRGHARLTSDEPPLLG
jgi:DNA-binding GntR family transcriptional regulator